MRPEGGALTLHHLMSITGSMVNYNPSKEKLTGKNHQLQAPTGKDEHWLYYNKWIPQQLGQWEIFIFLNSHFSKEVSFKTIPPNFLFFLHRRAFLSFSLFFFCLLHLPMAFTIACFSKIAILCCSVINLFLLVKLQSFIFKANKTMLITFLGGLPSKDIISVSYKCLLLSLRSRSKLCVTILETTKKINYLALIT